MATSKQPIETPTTPPAGDADPRAALVPATSAAEIISEESTDNSGEVVPNGASLTNAEIETALEEFEKLDKEAFEKADELADAYQEVVRRFKDELLPIVYRAWEFLSQRGAMHIPGLPLWTVWRDRLLARLTVKMSVRTLQRRLKEIRDLTNPEPEPEPDPEPDPAPVIYDSPKQQVTKWVEKQRKVLAGEIGPMDANPMRDGKCRIEAALQLLDEFQLALDDGLLDPVPQVVQLRHEINKHNHSELTVVPLHFREANELVAKLHRHHKPIRVAKFSIGATFDGKLVGAAICMRPACRSLDDGRTIEVCRLAVIPFEDDNDARNACSFLYGACARIARDMGYDKIMTYLLDTEPGMSVRGAGWTLEKKGCGGTPQGKRTNRPNGHEVTPVTFMKKQRWAKVLQTQTNKKAVSSVPVQVTEDAADVA